MGESRVSKINEEGPSKGQKIMKRVPQLELLTLLWSGKEGGRGGGKKGIQKGGRELILASCSWCREWR